MAHLWHIVSRVGGMFCVRRLSAVGAGRVVVTVTVATLGDCCCLRSRAASVTPTGPAGDTQNALAPGRVSAINSAMPTRHASRPGSRRGADPTGGP